MKPYSPQEIIGRVAEVNAWIAMAGGSLSAVGGALLTAYGYLLGPNPADYASTSGADFLKASAQATEYTFTGLQGVTWGSLIAIGGACIYAFAGNLRHKNNPYGDMGV